MHLYSGSTIDFVSDATRNKIAGKLEGAFFQYFRYSPGQSEVRSWQNSLRAMASVVELANLDDNGIVVEFQLPLSSRRLDCLLTGHDTADKAQAVIVELKQWEVAGSSEIEDCVTTFVGHRERDVLHPSRQVGNYARYLQDVQTTFSEGSVGLTACSFLHNMRYDLDAEVFANKHRKLIDRYPVFVGDQVDLLTDFLTAQLAEGDGGPVLDEVLKGKYRPHKRLLEHTARVIRREPAYTLLDEQQVAFNHILGKVRDRQRSSEQTVFLIKGGPGTGKSVIAVNLLAELSAEGFATKHATGSKAFTENLRRVVGPRAAAQFGYFNGFAGAEPQILDAIVCDESHRMRESSNNRFTKKELRSDLPQVEELIQAAKVSVFFIDDLQVVRPGEVGSSELITRRPRRLGVAGVRARTRGAVSMRRLGGVRWMGREHAGASAQPVHDVGPERGVRFRRRGLTSRARDAHPRQGSRGGRRRGCLQGSVGGGRTRATTGHSSATSRSVTGRCRGTPSQMPEARQGHPQVQLLGERSRGIEQVGCVYTAQGFEYDYAGVIFGRDLVWRPRKGWVGQPSSRMTRS